MEEKREENKALSFIRRWIKEFNRILGIVGNKVSAGNEEFVDEILSEEMQLADTLEKKEKLEEKRRLMIEMCEDVDTYHAKVESAEKSRDLEEWFNGEVSSLVHETIPDADNNDVEELADYISGSFDDDIKIHTSLIEDEFKSDTTSENNEPDSTNPNIK